MRPILVIAAPPPAGASPALIAAWERRLRADATGRCPECGAERELPPRTVRRAAVARGEPIQAQMLHEAGCSVSDDGLRALYRAGMS